jgi:hypothetical protein
MKPDSASGQPSESPDARVRAQVLFEGLVYSEAGLVAKAVWLGGVGHYAIPDGAINWHVEALPVDHAIIEAIKQQLASQQDEVVRAMLQMMGKDDIFTKAAIDASIRNMEDSIRQADNSQWLPWLQFMGFHVIVDLRGNIVDMVYPTQSTDEDDDS